jgi:large subunit ribosomal protein L25
MEEIILNAIERTKEHGKFRELGFIPGVIYGDNVEATSVKFEELPLKRILTKHGSNAKVWVKYGSKKNFGFIKEIQRHPVTNKIIHIDVQLVSKNHEVKLQLPITFKGENNLKEKQLQLHVYKTEVDVIGKMALMPDVIEIDISNKELGDTITLKDFNFDKQISVSDKEDEIYAAITHIIAQPIEEPVEAEAETTV